MHFVGYIQGVAFGLAIHVEKHGGFAVGGHHGVDRSDRRHDFRDVAETYGDTGRGCLDDDLSNLFWSANLATDETQYKLMTVLDQPRRIDEIGTFDGVQNVRDSNPHSMEARGVGRHLKFGNAAPLYDHDRNAIEPVEARLKVVSGNLPQLVWRNSVRRQAVPNDGKDCEGHAVRFHLRRRRKVRLQTSHNRVHALERQNHVRVPVEKEIHLGGTAAGHRINLLQAGHAVD